MKRTVIKAYPQLIQDAWALWQAFRKLGFTADEIDFTISKAHPTLDPSMRLWLFLVLTTQGKTFTAYIGPLGVLSPDRTNELWRTWARTLNAGEFDEAKLWTLYRTRFLEREPGPATLLISLKAKGFVLPGPAHAPMDALKMN